MSRAPPEPSALLDPPQPRFDAGPTSSASPISRTGEEPCPSLIPSAPFGEWARACARLCRERGLSEPLRYAPDPGRGAVIAREEPDGAYAVLSALGMGPGWETGRPVGAGQVRRARPLR